MYVYWILYLVHIGGDYTIYCGHAPRGACELKSLSNDTTIIPLCHAPRGACELKSVLPSNFTLMYGHAPRGACELKWK